MVKNSDKRIRQMSNKQTVKQTSNFGQLPNGGINGSRDDEEEMVLETEMRSSILSSEDVALVSASDVSSEDE